MFCCKGSIEGTGETVALVLSPHFLLQTMEPDICTRSRMKGHVPFLKSPGWSSFSKALKTQAILPS